MTNKYKNRIIIDPEIMVGKPIIKGTRITVELILRLLAQGQGIDEILQAYPHLKREDIYAALKYAGEIIEEERVLPLRSAFKYA
ncbi:DUF433 domain-containing protein [Candidatus Parcubacteria bacterium]|nr:DUF433 domain-containing protein [Candidatus Parcubacteria bacterium]